MKGGVAYSPNNFNTFDVNTLNTKLTFSGPRGAYVIYTGIDIKTLRRISFQFSVYIQGEIASSDMVNFVAALKAAWIEFRRGNKTYK